MATILTLGYEGPGTGILGKNRKNKPETVTTATDTKAPAAGGATSITLGSPEHGTVIPLADVLDPVFSKGMIGPGIAVMPSDSTIVAPCAGRLIVAPDSGHAYGIATPDGVEVLIHVGIDTFNLQGKGFTTHVKLS